MPIRVAIVEDDTVTRETLVVQISRALGLSLMPNYARGEEATKALPTNLPDLVLMDINLPTRRGIECVIDLRTRYSKLQIGYDEGIAAELGISSNTVRIGAPELVTAFSGDSS